MSALRQLGWALLAFSCVLLSAVLIAEVYLRVIRFGSDGVLAPHRFMAPAFQPEGCLESGPDGELLRPGCRTHFRGVPVAINAAGLRDRAVDEARPHYRIAVFGGSTTFGSGVAIEDVYHSDLEARLDARIAPDGSAAGFVEIMNFGREWWTTSDNLRDLEAALAAPTPPVDAVLVAITPADVVSNALSEHPCRSADAAPLVRDAMEAFYDEHIMGRSDLWQGLGRAERLTGLWVFERLKTIARFAARTQPLPPSLRQTKREIDARGVRVFAGCVERFRALADEDGFELAWVQLWYTPQRPGVLLSKQVRAAGEPLLDLSNVQAGLGPGTPLTIYVGDLHPHRDIHRIYAARLLAFLDEIGWIGQIRAAYEARVVEPGRG